MVRSRGKWAKHNTMVMNSRLKSALPATKLLNKRSFFHFLQRYRHIIVKPSSGSGGVGVIQVTTVSSDRFKVHYEKKQTTVSKKNLYPLIRRLISTKRRYIVQRKISLLKINGKPFDLRVMVQRKKGTGWLVTGIMAKVAGSGYFITNLVRSKGKALPLSTAIRRCNGMFSTRMLERNIRGYALLAVKQLQKQYRLRTVGLDMGIDQNGKVWIIEANFNPDKTYFRRLKDKTMYRRIMALYKKR